MILRVHELTQFDLESDLPCWGHQDDPSSVHEKGRAPRRRGHCPARPLTPCAPPLPVCSSIPVPAYNQMICLKTIDHFYGILTLTSTLRLASTHFYQSLYNKLINFNHTLFLCMDLFSTLKGNCFWLQKKNTLVKDGVSSNIHASLPFSPNLSSLRGQKNWEPPPTISISQCPLKTFHDWVHTLQYPSGICTSLEVSKSLLKVVSFGDIFIFLE